jgi:hypothetical protein
MQYRFAVWFGIGNLCVERKMTITLTREEAQQVLEALEAEHSAIYGTSQTVKATELLRTRLAQSEPEPVAWCIVENGRVHGLVKSKPAVMNADKWQPLYTTPPQRNWQGLTDEEIM